MLQCREDSWLEAGRTVPGPVLGRLGRVSDQVKDWGGSLRAASCSTPGGPVLGCLDSNSTKQQHFDASALRRFDATRARRTQHLAPAAATGPVRPAASTSSGLFAVTRERSRSAAEPDSPGRPSRPTGRPGIRPRQAYRAIGPSRQARPGPVTGRPGVASESGCQCQ